MSRSTQKNLRIEEIQRKAEIQARVTLRPEIIEEYAQAISSGAKFPPAVVYFDGKYYWLADGNYRITASKKAGRKTIGAIVYPGTLRDAILYAVGANATHGERRTNKDKERAVLILLQDEEWTGKSDNWIATKTHVDSKTVARIRADFGIPKPKVVKTANGRLMNTSKIGQGKSRKAKPHPATKVVTADRSKRKPVVAAESEPNSWPEIDESIADSIPTFPCPHCAGLIPHSYAQQKMEGRK